MMTTKIKSKLNKILESKKLSKEKLEQFYTAILYLANERLKQKIKQVLSDEDFENIERLRSTEKAQEYIRKRYEELTGKKIADLMEKIYNNIESSLEDLVSEITLQFNKTITSK